MFNANTIGRGEIVANTGARMTLGYYGDNEKTNQAFVMLGGEKFFRTGDLGIIKKIETEFKIHEKMI